LKEKFVGHPFLCPEDDDTLLDTLKVVTIPGHTADCEAILDTRDNIMITGDCLQLYGIFGSGLWASNINLPDDHVAAVEKVRNMKVDRIVTAHDYHPYGRSFFGKAEIEAALDACLSPFKLIQKLMAESPDADDEAICKKYNAQGNLPTLGLHVVKKYRETVFCTGSTLFS
jgi:glyoxylase-like metal-dependent hydrolase (beta-lactamase superfamily II)